MIGLGTIINTIAIVIGGIIGNFTGKLFKQEQQSSLEKACGISMIFIATAGAMQGMMHIDSGTMYPDQMIRNGGTACLQSNRKNFVDQDTPSATTVKYLQNAIEGHSFILL